jgi:hypothetical protein
VIKVIRKTLDMVMNWNELDLETLKANYEQESMNLKTALLQGTSWEELRDQRKTLTDLAIALHKKMHSSDNPAESADRSVKRIPR